MLMLKYILIALALATISAEQNRAAESSANSETPVQPGVCVRLLSDAAAFRSSFSRFSSDPLNGLTDAKLARIGQLAKINTSFGDYTATCEFQDGTVLDLPYESFVVEQCDHEGARSDSRVSVGSAPLFSVLSTFCRFPAITDGQPAWNTKAAAASGCDPAEGCLAFVCKEGGCYPVRGVNWDLYARSAYIWEFSDGLFSIRCEGPQDWVLYRDISSQESWDGSRVPSATPISPTDLFVATDLDEHPKEYEQVLAVLHRDGIAVVSRPLFSEAEVVAINQHIDQYFHAVQNETGGVPGELIQRGGIAPMEPKGPAFTGHSFRISGLINKGGILETIPQHPVLLKLAQAHMGTAVKWSDMTFISLAPGDGHGDWHPDVHLGARHAPGCQRVKFFIWLDEVSADNGATGFIRGSAADVSNPSYSPKQLEESRLTLEESRLKHGANATPTLPWPYHDGAVFYPTGSKGYGLMYDPFTLHANGANRSPVPRRIISIVYVQAGCTEAVWGHLPRGTVAQEVLARQSSDFLEVTHDFFEKQD